MECLSTRVEIQTKAYFILDPSTFCHYMCCTSQVAESPKKRNTVAILAFLLTISSEVPMRRCQMKIQSLECGAHGAQQIPMLEWEKEGSNLVAKAYASHFVDSLLHL